MNYWHIDTAVEIYRTHHMQFFSSFYAHNMSSKSPLHLGWVICIVLAVEVTSVTVKFEALIREWKFSMFYLP